MTSSHNCTRVCVLLQHKSPEVVTLPSTEASLNELRAPKSRPEAVTKSEVIPQDDPSVPKRRKVKVIDEIKYCVLRHSTLISASLGTKELHQKNFLTSL